MRMLARSVIGPSQTLRDGTMAVRVENRANELMIVADVSRRDCSSVCSRSFLNRGLRPF